MASEERAQRAANNKSIRIIKNELEALAERGFISDDQYDTIVAALPAEASLNGRPIRAPTNTYQAEPANANLSSTITTTTSDRDPSSSHAPPSYQQTQHHNPPPTTAPPSHKEIAHAVALWQYTTPDARDLNMHPGDHISVSEFVNAEWWLGRNLRTGEEGVFPSNYIRRENFPSPLVAQSRHQEQQQQIAYHGDQKYSPSGSQQHWPGPSDPYSNPVPPMAVAEQQHSGDEKPSKGVEMGKKLGSKLGNAAIFGAGATIGGNIVNSIF